jgi:hypothetical protein
MATLVFSLCATLGLVLACLGSADPAAGRSRWLPSDRARLDDGAARSLEAFGTRHVENAATRGSGPSVRAHQGQKRWFGKICSGPATGVQAMAVGPLPLLVHTAERLHPATDVQAAPGSSGARTFHAPRGPPVPLG